jgi:two-component system invasion response regulator UvrY
MIHAVRMVFRGQRFVSSEVAQKHTLMEWEGRANNPFQRLSTRETQVLQQILEGRRNQEISDILCLSPKTISTYRQRILEKLDIRNASVSVPRRSAPIASGFSRNSISAMTWS